MTTPYDIDATRCRTIVQKEANLATAGKISDPAAKVYDLRWTKFLSTSHFVKMFPSKIQSQIARFLRAAVSGV